MSSPDPVTSRRGFFWTGIERVQSQYGTVVRGPMYVEWEEPVEVTQPYPIVLIHGGGGQGLDWMQTYDGRPGWAPLLVQRGYKVYVVDRPGHGRSSLHPDVIAPMGAPFPFEAGVGIFRSPTDGPRSHPTAHLHTQWPGTREDDDPALEAIIVSSGPVPELKVSQELDQSRGAELLDRIGPAVLMAHSLGGPAGWLIADARPDLVKALVEIEAVGPPFAENPQLGLTLDYGLTAAPLTYEPPVDDPAELGGKPRRLPNLARVPPAASDEHSLTVGPAGPIVLHDHYVVQKMQHFNRERVPERVVHAKGGGAHGFFEVTEDVTPFTRASFLSQVGKRTDMFARFSTVAGEQGFPDTVRDPRGFALKFYTDEGNFDMVGNNTPVFFVRDPSKFQDFIHSQKRLPDTGLRSNDMQWDFWTLSPESAHQVTILMSDRGIPASWRHMDGFSSHTYSWINAAGERFWVKYHLKTNQGIRNLTGDEAARLAGEDGDHHRRDLHAAIAAGDAPEWTFYVQVMPFAEAADYRFNSFDLTKVWPKGDYPLIEVGRMVLDRNPANFFAEVEQASFSPSNLVPGTGLSPDRMLMARIFSYHDTHLHRIGPNYEQLPINRPQCPVHSYNKDGQMTYHASDQPVYAPNSYGGPAADPARGAEIGWDVDAAELARTVYERHAEDDDFSQPGTLVREVMDDAARETLVSNIVEHASDDVSSDMQLRVIAYWTRVDEQIGARVAAGLGHGNGSSPSGELREAQELIDARAGTA